MSRNSSGNGNVPGTITVLASGGADGNGDDVKVTISNKTNNVDQSIVLTTGSIVTANMHPNEGTLLHSISVNGVQYKLPSYNEITNTLSDLHLKEGEASLGDYTGDVNEVRKGYIVGEDGVVTLTITDDNGKEADDPRIHIANIAQASDVGNISDIRTDGAVNVTNPTSVVNHINNLYSEVNTINNKTSDWRLVGAKTSQSSDEGYVYNGAYSVGEDNNIVLNVQDQTKPNSGADTVVINNVAKASDIGRVTEITTDLTEGTTNNIVNHINNLYQQVSEEASKDTIVKNNDNNIVVKKETNENGVTAYGVSLAPEVYIQKEVKVGNAITLTAEGGVINAVAMVADTVRANSYISVGAVTVGSGYVQGLKNTTWDPTASYYGGYAATQEQLKAAVENLKGSISAYNNLSVNGGNEVDGNHHGWTLTDNNGTADAADDVKYRDTTLDKEDSGKVVSGSATNSTYGQDFQIVDTAGNVVTINDIASAQKLEDVDKRLTTVEATVSRLDTEVNNLETQITNVSGEKIINGSVGDDGRITLVKDKKTDGTNHDTMVLGGRIHDNSLVAKDYEVEKDNGVNVVKLEIKDGYDNNAASAYATIKDIARDTDLQVVENKIGDTKYEKTNFIKDGDTLTEADVNLDKAIANEVVTRYEHDQAIINYANNQAQYLDSRINQVNSRVNKVGAGAAALAALHPMDFDPDDKLSFAVGAGNYAGENATALGAFYRPNEKVMMSVGGTYGNGENMVNMGVSFALDRTNNVSNSRTAMAKEIVDLREQVATQGQQIAQLVALVQQLAGATQSIVPAEQLFPDVPQNHWAYEYVNGLVAKGIIEGYPDGTFGGDRTMTRYEFAVMLFRAMEQGVVLSEQIRQEFEPELGRIRVDRVKGTDADLNKIERVRVNTAVDRDDYGSKVVQVKH